MTMSELQLRPLTPAEQAVARDPDAWTTAPLPEERLLNWAGHSIETIAAMYEADSAAREAVVAPKDQSAQGYWQSAWRAECKERELDEASVS